jgi:hypothetical protein
MRRAELSAFWAVTALVLLIPLVVGAAGSLGGLEGLAALFRLDERLVVPASLRNSLRAICWMFFALPAIVVWTLRSLVERAWGFRIVTGFAAAAGLVRLVGWRIDGDPGTVPIVFTVLELVLLPACLVWHWRLVERARLT